MNKRLLALPLAALLLLSACGRPQADPAPQPETPPVTDAPPVTPEVPAAPAEAGDYLPATDAYAGMNDPAFWAALCAAPDELRMTAEDIAAYNASAVSNAEALCADLDGYPESLDRYALEKAVKTYGQQPSAEMYTGAERITGGQQGEIYNNLNLAGIADRNPVRCGFIVRTAALRTWPSPLELYDSANDLEYDKARETTLRLWEPVLALHASADGAWLLVQAYNYLGWVAAEDVALTDRAEWTRLRGLDFLTVRAARLALGDSVYTPALNGTVLTMGVRLPLSGSEAVDNAAAVSAHSVLLPLRAEDGGLTLAEARVPYSEDVCLGCPALTDRALLEQAFRLLGQRYGWGGMFGGWDCSSICADIYAVFGVMLPRNASRQIRTGTVHDLSAASEEEKLALLADCRPGALVEIRGHMMFWLGVYDGTGYVFHSTYGFQPAGQPFTVTNSVVVSSVDALRSGGGTILENVRAASEIE